MVVGMETDTRHLVLFMAAPQILLPVRELRIDGAERDQHTRAVTTAIFHQPGVGAREIFVKYSIESARPSLGDVAFAETGHKIGWLVSNQPPERPSGKVHVHVDHYAEYPFARSIGVSRRFRFSPRINFLADSEMSAPITLPSCEAILRPKASLP